ncbi:MAG TPA: hypothetical protein VNO55_25290 [Polyangia bacterium]|nr:hypothetical protein [Polyangia bacterium]
MAGVAGSIEAAGRRFSLTILSARLASAGVLAGVLAGLALVAGVAVPSRARANGAFPDSLQLLLPADRPQQIIVSTTFGLIISDDNAKTWSWTCEQDNTMNAGLYQVGPPSQNRLYALSADGLAFSDDVSCTWTLAGGALDTALTTDSFVDRSDPLRVLAIGVPDNAAMATPEVFVSSDGGTTFGPSIYKAPADSGLTGVEIARSDPKVIYLAMFTTPGFHPKLVRTADGGAHWDPPIDLEPSLGANGFRIIAVDPANPNKIFLRVQAGLHNILAISEDGGRTIQTPITVDTLTAFVRLASGTILVTGQTNMAGVGFRSTDGGKTFQPWTNVPNVRALAERDGKLYISADNTKDGFALAMSTDAGATLHPLLTFDKVSSIRPCVQTVCEASCDMQAGLKVWPPETCHPDLPKPPMPMPATKSGCAYVSSGRALSPRGGALLFILGTLAWLHHRRRSRRR